MELEHGDLVLCTVERIEGTIVFVKISRQGEELDGSIVISEIAPGRIRNLRDYVVPKKKIVCKVLRISGNGNIELSLRRVTAKEQKEVLEQIRQEKSYSGILRNILGGKFSEAVKKVTSEESLYDFINEAKENPEKLERLVGKSDSAKILEAVKTEKGKKVVLKKEFFLKSSQPNGLELIKTILGNIKNAEVVYISAGKYFLKTESDDIKKTDNALKSVLSEIEIFAKKNKMEFSTK